MLAECALLDDAVGQGGYKGVECALAVGVGRGNDRVFEHVRECREGALDLAELDAEASHLHLSVDAAKETDLPVGAQAHEVAGAVVAAALGVRGEAVRGLLRHAVVTGGQADAADVQLALGADGDIAAGGIDDAQPLPGVGRADGDALAGIERQCGGGVAEGHGDGGLGGPVGVVEAGAFAEGRFPERGGLAGQHISADKAEAQLMAVEGARVLPGMVQDLHGVGGRQFQLRESALDDDAGKLVGGPLGVRRADDGVAEHEIGESAVDAGVEGRRGEEAGAAVAFFQ